MKQGILVVDRGTIGRDIREKTIQELVLSIQDRFPDAIVENAFTSGEVRKFIRERDGEKIRDVRASLMDMKSRGVTDLMVLSTHILYDAGYGLMREEVNSLAQLFSDVKIARPLLETDQDIELFVRACHSAFKDSMENGYVILIAEGMKNDEEKTLERLVEKLPALVGDRLQIASIDGSMKIYHALRRLEGVEGKSLEDLVKEKEEEVESHSSSESVEMEKVSPKDTPIYVLPLMFLMKGAIGERDLDLRDQYLASIDYLTEKGYHVEQLSEGLGEYTEFLRLYLRHLFSA